MYSVDEVAIIDEIQMIRDTQRGWAWTRALLGLCAQEVHLCGEASTIDLVQELMTGTGDEMEVSYAHNAGIYQVTTWQHSMST